MIEKLNGIPEAYAEITGIEAFPEIRGSVSFYEVYDGTIVMAEIYGLPDKDTEEMGGFYGFHIHGGKSCTGTVEDPLINTEGHLNLSGKEHPYHIGDLPPLLSVNGAAWLAVYTGRFHPEDIIGKAVVIHYTSDDFVTQPAGMSGMKIACGEIREGVLGGVREGM